MKLLNDYGLYLEVIFLFVFKHKRICNKAKGCWSEVAFSDRIPVRCWHTVDIPNSVSCVQAPADISWLLSWLSALCLSLRLTGICQPFLMGVFFLSQCNLFVWRIWFYLLQTRKNNVCCSKKEQRLTDRYTLSISMLSCYACGLIVHVFNTSTLAHHCT